MIYLLALIAVLLAYLVHLLRSVLDSMEVTHENLQRMVEIQVSVSDGIRKINRALLLNFKHEDDRFSETRVEELLRSGDFLGGVMYRHEMSTDLVQEGVA